MSDVEFIHESKSVRVTKSEVQFGKQAVSTSDIQSVTKQNRSKDLSVAIVLTIVAVLVASGILIPGSGGLVLVLRLGIAGVLIGAAVFAERKSKRRYAVIIRTASNAYQIASDEDEKRIDEIVGAVQSTLHPPASPEVSSSA